MSVDDLNGMSNDHNQAKNDEANPIYLDYNATTPLHPEVVSAIKWALDETFGNPSSAGYASGRKAAQAIKTARQEVARMVGAIANPDAEITFTSGGTESNHLAMWSAIETFRESNPGRRPHVVTTNIEHVAVDLPLKQWSSKSSDLEVTLVAVDRVSGRVAAEAVAEAVKANTCLVSVMFANNETGVIQPIADIAHLICSLNRQRRSSAAAGKIFFHTDASQAFGKIRLPSAQQPPHPDWIKADYVTICGHKFYGPRIGALYHKAGCPIHPLFQGGGQEMGRRPGTENTPMVVGLGAAAKQVNQHSDQWIQHFNTVRRELESALQDEFEGQIQFNFRSNILREKGASGGDSKNDEDEALVLPNTLSVRLPSFKRSGGGGGDEIHGWEVLKGCRGLVEASTASACHTGSCAQPSKVLLNSGLSDSEALRTLRLSVGYNTTLEDVRTAAKIISTSFKELCVNSDN